MKGFPFAVLFFQACQQYLPAPCDATSLSLRGRTAGVQGFAHIQLWSNINKNIDFLKLNWELNSLICESALLLTLKSIDICAQNCQVPGLSDLSQDIQ